MYKLTCGGVTITVHNGILNDDEAENYVARGRELYGKNLTEIIATIDPDDSEMIELEYKWNREPFHRLRRITGYLVGNLSRWNNGKKAEERDRVKHGTEV